MSDVAVALVRLADEPSSADAFLARLAATRLAVDIEDVLVTRHCRWCGSAAHGRPVVMVADRPPQHASMSYTSGLVAVCLSAAGPVGVDVEGLDGRRFDDLAAVLLHQQEAVDDPRGLATTWVRKESLVKATGDGLVVPLSEIQLSAPEESARLVDWQGTGRPSPSSVAMRDLDLGSGWVGCVSVLTDRPGAVTVTVAGPEDSPG
jgi:4'-phosphopantetheinyl transferase